MAPPPRPLLAFLMRLIVLTSRSRGLAARSLPALSAHPELQVARVVLAGPPPQPRARTVRRTLRKTLEIGLLGALNGVRMRAWHRDDTSPELRSVCAELGVPLFETERLDSDRTRDLVSEADADLG